MTCTATTAKTAKPTAPVDPLAELYRRANKENSEALDRAIEAHQTGLYSLRTDSAGDVWVVKKRSDDPSRVEIEYLQGVFYRRRSPLSEPVGVASCMCPAYRKAHDLNSELFRAGYKPSVLCKHGHIQAILEAHERNAQTSVTSAERFSLAMATAKKVSTGKARTLGGQPHRALAGMVGAAEQGGR